MKSTVCTTPVQFNPHCKDSPALAMVFAYCSVGHSSPSQLSQCCVLQSTVLFVIAASLNLIVPMFQAQKPKELQFLPKQSQCVWIGQAYMLIENFRM